MMLAKFSEKRSAANVLKDVAKKVVPPGVRRAIRVAFPYRPPEVFDDNLRYASYRPLHPRQFINIGAGDFSHPHWTNIDHASAHYAKDQKREFIEYDLNAFCPLPLEAESVSLAYTSHTIEHVKDEAVVNLFAEIHRVLKPGGIFRITCPDADLFYLSVKLGRAEYWNWRRDFFGYRDGVGIHDYVTREIASERVGKIDPSHFMRHFNALCKEEFLDWLVAPCAFNQDKPGGHINWWNHDKCNAALNKVGFRTTWRSSYGASLASPMQDTKRFDSTYPVMSLYAEAIKDR